MDRTGYIGWRWAAVLVLAGLAVVSFRGVALEFRRTAWVAEADYSVLDRARLMLDLLGERSRSEGAGGTILHGFRVLASRSANMDMFADVVRRTPVDIPHWDGATYVSLVGMAVPRFIWPDKPTKELGQAFGHRYRYLDETNLSTSINLPYFVEFYVNFGELGIILGMLFVGLIYRCLEFVMNRPGQSALQSLIALILLAPLWNIESDFSLTFGGLLLNGVALWMVYRVIRRSGRRRAGVGSSPTARRIIVRASPAGVGTQ
jgi:hypothetical protein